MTTHIKSEEAIHIKEILNTWKRVAIAIQHKVYNEELLYKAYATMVIQIWIKFSPFINARQARSIRHRGVYENFI